MQENADTYQNLLEGEIFKEIREKSIRGFLRIQLLRRALPNQEVEFVTIMCFSSLEAVKEFSGEDYEAAVVPESARKLLINYDETSQHYEVIDI